MSSLIFHASERYSLEGSYSFNAALKGLQYNIRLLTLIILTENTSGFAESYITSSLVSRQKKHDEGG